MKRVQRKEKDIPLTPFKGGMKSPYTRWSGAGPFTSFRAGLQRGNS